MQFSQLRIEDVCGFVGGSQPPKSEFISSPKEGYVRLIQTRDYKTAAFPTYIRSTSTKKFCDANDIMIGRYGPPIFQICRGLTGAYNVALLKAKPQECIDREYLYYFLKQDAVFQYVDKLSARTGGQTGVDLVSLNKYPIRLPEDIFDQQKLVSVLSALDAKIDCNNRINAELEAMAKTLYDYWFVQFDFPNANGNPYKSYDGKMVYSATLKREIPEGWRDGSLWEIARYFNGLPMQKHRPTGSEYLPVIKIKEMGAGITVNSEKASPNIPLDAIVEDGDVLFSWSATLDIKIWSQGKGALNQHIFKVTSDTYPKTFYYFELLAYLAHFKMMAENRKTTMGHITQDHLKQSRICIPPIELLCWAHNQIEPILTKHLLFERENLQLTQLRDWLLPLLMNGQVTAY